MPIRQNLKKIKLSLILILIFIILFQCKKKENSIINNDVRVFYSGVHNSVWSLWDTGFYGYSKFALTLIEDGIYVSEIWKDLSKRIQEFKIEELNNIIIVLNVAKFQQYSENEIEVIIDFVKKGGRLFLIGEHDNIYKVSDFQNMLLKNFGIIFNNDSAEKKIKINKSDKYSTEVLNNISESQIFNLKKVYHLKACSLKKLSHADNYEVLLTDKNKGKSLTISAGVSFGKGRVLALGDSEIFWNGDNSIGIEHGDNKKFLISSIKWLLKKEKFNIGEKPQLNFGKGEKVIFIDSSFSGRKTDDSPGGIKFFAAALADEGFSVISGNKCSKYDIRIIARPLKEVKLGKNFNKKLILFVEPYHDFTLSNLGGKILSQMDAVNLPSIYRFLEKQFSFSMEKGVIACQKDNDYFLIDVKLDNTIFNLNRAASFKGKTFRKLVNLRSKLWVEVDHPGMHIANRGVPKKDEYESAASSIMIYNNSLFLCGDSGLITNAESKEESFSAIVDILKKWINGGAVR